MKFARFCEWPLVLRDFVLTFRKGTPWYIIGRSLSNSDIHVNSEDGVSGCHLRLGFDQWGQVVIEDTSTFGCELTYLPLKSGTSSTTSTTLAKDSSTMCGRDNDDEERHQRNRSEGNRKNPPTWVIPVGWQVIVRLGDCESLFYFEVPDHSDYSQEYQQKVMAFKSPQNNPISFLGGLALNSQRAVTRGLFTAAQRATLEGKEGRYAWIISGTSLGSGGFGEVFEVFNTINWCMCAGKRINEEVSFQNESDVLRRLQHKHIVQYIDVEERRPASPSMIIMEYFPLGDLSRQHKRQPFSESDIVDIIAQIASALKYLHENKVTHRDLKPHNILVRSREPVEIAVTDFGVSKSEESVMCTLAGTYQYMAPEVVSNNPETSKHMEYYTNSVDIWSLGMVAVEMLIGGLPARVSELSDASYAINVYKTRDKLLARCKNREFAALVREMLELSHYERPSAADCFERASSMVPAAQSTASNHCDEASRRKEKDPAEGMSTGSAASTVRVLKRAGSDISTAMPPAKRTVATAPSMNPSVATSSTKRDVSWGLESTLLDEQDQKLAQTSKSEEGPPSDSAGRASTPGAPRQEKMAAPPPTEFSDSSRES